MCAHPLSERWCSGLWLSVPVLCQLTAEGFDSLRAIQAFILQTSSADTLRPAWYPVVTIT